MQEFKIDKYLNQLVKITDPDKITQVGILHKITDYKDESGKFRDIKKGYYIVNDQREVTYKISYIKGISKLKENTQLKKPNKEGPISLRKQICDEIRKEMKEMYFITEEEFLKILDKVEKRK